MAAVLAVMILLLVPALDLVSGSGGDGDGYCPLHASPAVLTSAVSVPIVTGAQLGFMPAASQFLPSGSHAIFVPPRA